MRIGKVIDGIEKFMGNCKLAVYKKLNECNEWNLIEENGKRKIAVRIFVLLSILLLTGSKNLLNFALIYHILLLGLMDDASIKVEDVVLCQDLVQNKMRGFAS